ncbi:hypothetical protein BU16DRAFT_568042 [Lophium mytilinum]|uniref:Uncharacterized protein n=1 Tax=Lophium mytilinum TaxID=390894 RepID=A0A6A6Q8X4_9PEZI|nr:hypothetical protein BU16DRAFT_568042 [Lophium mytilinum]
MEKVKQVSEYNADGLKSAKRKQTGSSVLGVVAKKIRGKSFNANNTAFLRRGLPDTTGRNERIKKKKMAKERAIMEKEAAGLLARTEREAIASQQEKEELSNNLLG